LCSVNLANVEAAPMGNQLPEGYYYFRIRKAEEASTKDGQTQRVQIRLEVVQGPGSTEKNAGDNFFHSYLLSDKGMRFFKRFLKVVEIGDEYLVNGLDYDWLTSREFVGQIVHKDGYCNLVNERAASAWADLIKGNGQAAKIATPAAAAPPTQAFTPQQPAMAPQQPAMAPQQPAMAPQQPAMAPQQPAMAPQQPAFTPQQPAMAPQQPVAQQPPMAPSQTSMQAPPQAAAQAIPTPSAPPAVQGAGFPTPTPPAGTVS
jgi:hypothetical protein